MIPYRSSPRAMIVSRSAMLEWMPLYNKNKQKNIFGPIMVKFESNTSQKLSQDL